MKFQTVALTSILSLLAGNSYAAYLIQYPLEQPNGGSLPSGSIKIGDLVSTDPEEPEDPDIDYPSSSELIVLNMFNGSVIYGNHPQVNSISYNHGNNILYYTINSKEVVTVQYNAGYTDEGAPILEPNISNTVCNKIGKNNYNCTFNLTTSAGGLDGGGNSLNDYINSYAEYPFVYQLHISISN